MRRYEIERDDEGLPVRMIWLGDDDVTDKELLERVARAVDAALPVELLPDTLETVVKTAFAALRPGDELGVDERGHLRFVTSDYIQYMNSRGERADAARQAAEATREAAAQLCEKLDRRNLNEKVATVDRMVVDIPPVEIAKVIRALDLTKILEAKE